MRNISGLSPCLPSLDAIPKFVFDRFTRIRKTKDTLFGDRDRSNFSFAFVHHNCLVPNGPNKCRFFAEAERVPNMRPKECIVTRRITLSLYPARVVFGFLLAMISLPLLVKEMAIISPSSLVRIPSKYSNLTI